MRTKRIHNLSRDPQLCHTKYMAVVYSAGATHHKPTTSGWYSILEPHSTMIYEFHYRSWRLSDTPDVYLICNDQLINASRGRLWDRSWKFYRTIPTLDTPLDNGGLIAPFPAIRSHPTPLKGSNRGILAIHTKSATTYQYI